MMTFTAQHRQKLEEVRRRKREARDKMNAASAAIKIANEHSDPGAAGHAEVAKEVAVGEYTLAVELESALIHQAAQIGDPGGPQESCLDDPGVIRQLEQVAHSAAPVGSMMLGNVHSRDEVVAMIESGSWKGKSLAQTTVDTGPPSDPSRVGPYQGIIPQLRYRLTVLDLIPTATMEAGSFYYTQEVGDFSQGVGETAEGAIKPSSSMTLTDAQCVAVTIATWARLKRQQLEDVAGLATTVNSRLTYQVMRRLQTQIIAGDGVGDNMLGIVNQTGIADVTFAAGEALTDLTLSGITDVILSEAEPNGVVLNPVDWQAMLGAKTSGSGQRLDSNGAFATPPNEMWGLPTIVTKAMAQGTALVGDFVQGATLHVRQGVNLRVSDADSDNFIRNEVTALAEGRFGLAVWRPACFALVHFA